MKTLLLLLIMINFGCARVVEPNVEIEFKSYVAEFEKTFKYPVKSSVEFINALPNPQMAGVCDLNSDKVKISRHYWDKYSQTQRTQLIFHELGHCVFKLSHNSSLDSQGWPVSLMNSTMIAEPVFESRFEYYINQLRDAAFNRR